LRVLAHLSQIDVEYLGVLYVSTLLIEKRPDRIRPVSRGVQQFKTNLPAAYNVIRKNTGIKDKA